MNKGSSLRNDADQARLERFALRIGSGEFHKPIAWDGSFGIITPVTCIDGRPSLAGTTPIGPSAAGGTKSLWVACDLTEDMGAVEGYRQVIDHLSVSGYAIGGHVGDREVDAASIDCGAYDSLVDIYGHIAGNHDRLRTMSAELGLAIDIRTSRSLARSAARRRDLPSSAELFDYMRSRANPALIDCLTGEHREVLIAVNTVKGTTIDRRAVQSVFGHDHQAFNMDLWAFEDAAIAVSKNEAEIPVKHAAIAYYNLATAMALSGPAIRMVVI